MKTILLVCLPYFAFYNSLTNTNHTKAHSIGQSLEWIEVMQKNDRCTNFKFELMWRKICNIDYIEVFRCLHLPLQYQYCMT